MQHIQNVLQLNNCTVGSNIQHLHLDLLRFSHLEISKCSTALWHKNFSISKNTLLFTLLYSLFHGYISPVFETSKTSQVLKPPVVLGQLKQSCTKQLPACWLLIYKPHSYFSWHECEWWWTLLLLLFKKTSKPYSNSDLGHNNTVASWENWLHEDKKMLELSFDLVKSAESSNKHSTIFTF